LNASPPARLVARRQSARPRSRGSEFQPAQIEEQRVRGVDQNPAGGSTARGRPATCNQNNFAAAAVWRTVRYALLRNGLIGQPNHFTGFPESSPTGYRAIRVRSPSRQLRYSWLVAEIKAAIYCSIELCADKPLSVRQIPRVQSRATAPHDPERLLKRGDQRFRAGAFADFLVGGFFVGLVGLPGFEGCGGVAFTIVWRAESSAVPTGLPKPVHGSHPATA